MYQELYQSIIEYFSYEDFSKEYEQTRKDFERMIGKVHDEHSFFESWIEAFIEYFTFDSYLTKYGLTPLTLYAKMFQKGFTDQQKQAMDQLIEHKFTIVSFKSKQKDGGYLCQDMFDGSMIKYNGVDMSHELMLKKEDWMIIRSIQTEQAHEVFGSIWHFPKEIAHVLKKNLVRFEKQRLPFIHDCMAKKVFSESYQHVDLEKTFLAMQS